MNARNLRFLFVPAISSVISCASQKSQPEPEVGPPGVDIEYNDRDNETSPKSADSEPKGDDAASESSEAKAAKSDEDSSPKSSSEGKAEPAKRSCAGLKKSECQVTVGCAWSTDKVCLNQ